MSSTHFIPKIPPSIHNPTQTPTLLYFLAKHHTNEEIFIGLIALEERYTPVRCVDDVFNEIRDSIRAVARGEGRTDDEMANDLLKAQSENGVILRNREQVKGDRFGRMGRRGTSANEQRGVAWGILGECRGLEGRGGVEQRGDVEMKPTVDVQQAPCRDAGKSIRERMSLKHILK
ncbi:hypothetical protein M409DRAFT_59320 [Zasmidium cellare ATCC 36951]|uniref:Uncharacterized protein n=1 Tax=Zasmidium cellare ATCC 36951 TaxID=1080233 RepID=A0A6A6C2H8_ZASCE|nr:uncharacterized protein M409DRAFT_59320 [Zasmidium cellare ATCC 36951]KAF2161327.1 hypothetical protein M409DRAFT_59320 [Zasmidium cellare ATCC 36951]